jgi:hypothetical protein
MLRPPALSAAKSSSHSYFQHTGLPSLQQQQQQQQEAKTLELGTHEDSASAATAAAAAGTGAAGVLAVADKTVVPAAAAADDLYSSRLSRPPRFALVFRCTAFGRVAVAVALMGTIALLCYGAAVDAFAFQFRGLTGWLLGPNDGRRGMSLVNVGLRMAQDSRDPDAIATRWVQAVYFIFALAMPLAYTLCMLVAWLYPLTVSRHLKLQVCSDVLFAWASIEVFFISVSATVAQITSLAGFMVGTNCDAIDKVLVDNFSDLLGGDNVCFDLVATYAAGCWILLGASAVFLTMGFTVSLASNSALTGRLGRMRLLWRREQYASAHALLKACPPAPAAPVSPSAPAATHETPLSPSASAPAPASVGVSEAAAWSAECARFDARLRTVLAEGEDDATAAEDADRAFDDPAAAATERSRRAHDREQEQLERLARARLSPTEAAPQSPALAATKPPASRLPLVLRTQLWLLGVARACGLLTVAIVPTTATIAAVRAWRDELR